MSAAVATRMNEHGGVYSQYGEDAAIFANTPDSGRFLDIGAWHPTQFSNTRLLWERGWSGVMFEPSPGPLQNLAREYGNDDRVTVVGCAVGVERGLITMHLTEDAVSTSDPETFRKWKTAGGYYGKARLWAMSFDDVITQFGAFDLINLDAEGISVDLLHRLLRYEMYPACICVEHDGRESEVIQAATARGYKIVYGNGTNLVLAR